MSVRLGASAFNAFAGDVESFCAGLRELGLESCELRNFIGGDDVVDAAAVPRIRAALAANGLRSTVHAPWKLNLAATEARQRDRALSHFKRAVDVAAELGSDLVVFHGGWSEGEAERSRLLAERSIAALVEHAQGSGVKVALENDEVSRPTLFRHPHSFRGLDFPQLRFVLDLAHAHTMGYRCQDFLPVMAGRLAQLHLHDNDGSGDQHLPVGAGSVDFQGAAAALSGRDLLMVIECKSLPCLRRSIPAVLRWWPERAASLVDS